MYDNQIIFHIDPKLVFEVLKEETFSPLWIVRASEEEGGGVCLLQNTVEKCV